MRAGESAPDDPHASVLLSLLFPVAKLLRHSVSRSRRGLDAAQVFFVFDVFFQSAGRSDSSRANSEGAVA